MMRRAEKLVLRRAKEGNDSMTMSRFSPDNDY